MIVDAETLELVNAIESLLEDADDDGEIKPELHGVGARDRDRPRARTPREAGEQLRAPARARCARRPPARGLDDRLGRHAPVRDVGGPADRRAPALPRPGRRRCASSPARS